MEVEKGKTSKQTLDNWMINNYNGEQNRQVKSVSCAEHVRATAKMDDSQVC